ncbi:MAG: periplasmic heavy metal sensor [Deltaproteobacteria bacterium]|nr:periplasmic heavy metal sensor [Deltaproteobacteria bacterium]
MKHLFVVLLSMGLILFQGFPTYCGEKGRDESKEAYGDDMPAYGRCGHMMGYGLHGHGMRRGGSGVHHGWGWSERPRDWKSMTQEEQKKWEEMRAKHQMEILDLRKELVSKRVELETLWNQPQVDHGRIEKLSGEIAQIEAQLAKKRDKHLLECRKQFGDRGWTCPGSW